MKKETLGPLIVVAGVALVLLVIAFFHSVQQRCENEQLGFDQHFADTHKDLNLTRPTHCDWRGVPVP